MGSRQSSVLSAHEHYVVKMSLMFLKYSWAFEFFTSLGRFSYDMTTEVNGSGSRSSGLWIHYKMAWLNRKAQWVWSFLSPMLIQRLDHQN